MTSYAKIYTNGHIRPLLSLSDLPPVYRAQFDYVDDEEQTRFVLYRGSWHDVLDCQRICGPNQYAAFGFNVHESSPLLGWDAIATDSVWTGTVFRFPTDDEAFKHDIISDQYDYVIVGRYVA